MSNIIDLDFLIANESLFYDWYFRKYDCFYESDFKDLNDCSIFVYLKFQSYVSSLNNCNDTVLNFELRGDDYKILNDLIKYIPEDREDILSWVSYIQGDIFDLLNK